VASLNIQSARAQEILERRVAAGNELRERAEVVADQRSADAWRADRERWIRLTKEALLHVYSGQAEAEEFTSSAYRRVFFGDPGQDFVVDVRHVADAVTTLESLIDRLEYAEEAEAQRPGPPVPSHGAGVIFLVHGSDTGAREGVARFLEKAGAHRVVILDEQTNRGRTLIEKFEEHAGEASYAVVLLTADDVGGRREAGAQQARARQNVVFELGFFVGRIGRERVTVIYEPGVERPSDIDGLAYLLLDGAGAWREKLVRELRAAGLGFDLARA
jgi:predicted nucleotide-binding protein